MADRLRVDRAELADVMAEMKRLTTSAEEWLSDIDRMINRLHVTWTGPAAGMQAEAHAEWAAGAQEMRESLSDLEMLGTTAKENYDSAVEANLKMWRRG